MYSYDNSVNMHVRDISLASNRLSIKIARRSYWVTKFVTIGVKSAAETRHNVCDRIISFLEEESTLTWISCCYRNNVTEMMREVKGKRKKGKRE